MRICMVTSSFPTSVQGTHGTFVFQMARHINRLSTYEVTVLAPYRSDSPLVYELDGVKIKRFPYFYPHRAQILCEGAGIPANIDSSLARLQLLTYSLVSTVRTLCEKEVDVIHAHWPIPNAFGAVVRESLCKIPYINTVYGAEVYLAKRYRIGWLVRFLVGSSRKSIAISKATYEACVACGIPEDKLAIIPLGVDTDIFRPQEVLGEDLATFKIISVGRLIERKGFEYLVEAVSMLARRGYRIKLEIAGSGPRDTILRQHIERLEAQGYVELLGTRSPLELKSLYNRADLFVLPAIIDSKGDTEGLGVVYLEAMACRLPVIGTEVGGVPDLIQQGYNGLLVPQKDSQALAEAILDLMADRTKREELAWNGYRLALDMFDWRQIARRYAAVYESII